MNSKIPLILLGAATISASSFAETLTYDGSATGSFSDGAYWGGTLSPATVTSEIAILKAEAINWDNGKISFDLVEDNSASDKIVLDYALTKTSFSVSGGTREIELIADPYEIAAWIDASVDGKLTYTLIEYDSTDFKNGDIVFSQIDGINIDYDFGDTALTVTLSKVPEPATIAAIFGACALAMAAFRRRRK